MRKKIKNNEMSLIELEEELKLTNAAIEKTTDELNARRRIISELKSKKSILEDQIKAKKLEQLEHAVTNQYGMSIDNFMTAVKSGDIVVDDKFVPSTSTVSEKTSTEKD